MELTSALNYHKSFVVSVVRLFLGFNSQPFSGSA